MDLGAQPRTGLSRFELGMTEGNNANFWLGNAPIMLSKETR